MVTHHLAKYYRFYFFSILTIFFVLRVLPPAQNHFTNFYFTMDQGNDAVHVRELLHGNFPVLGPETSIFGLFAGPLWYYFIGIGYFFTLGHPIGPVFMLILLNTLTLGLLMFVLKASTSPWASLYVGGSLLTSWTLYDLSRYSFNPFPMFFLALLTLIFLSRHLLGHKLSFLLAAFPVGLSFHTDLASAIALSLFYLCFSAHALTTKRLGLSQLGLSLVIILLFLLPHGATEYTSHFAQTRTLLKELQSADSIFSPTQVHLISERFIISIARSTFRAIPELGVSIFVVALLLFFQRYHSHPFHPFTKYFISLSLCLFTVSWLFFITNSGWRDWHTNFLSPIIFICLLLALKHLPKYLAIFIYLLSLYSHLHTFIPRYLQYLHPPADPSILTHELATLDWIYSQAQGQGFSSYQFLPSLYDYPYQYLFWWHGLTTYGYLPCEFSPYPDAPKLYYRPLMRYTGPTRPCSNLFFLIIEPDPRLTPRTDWLTAISEHSTLVDQTEIGHILIQKRLKN